MTIKRTERGWTGHYILANECMFRRNTLLEKGDKKYIVSTVGARREHGYGDILKIGLNQYYETLVFRASLVDGVYWDSDTLEIIATPLKNEIHETSIESDRDANEMHEYHVDYIVRLLDGE